MKNSTKHSFLFKPQEWVGDGTITFNEFGHGLKFYTHWKMNDSTDEKITCIQEIEVEGLMDKTQNRFTLTEIKNNTFSITLENEKAPDFRPRPAGHPVGDEGGLANAPPSIHHHELRSGLAAKAIQQGDLLLPVDERWAA